MIIDNSSKAPISGAVAMKALNTVKVYCATHLCPECPLQDELEKDNHCPIPKLDLKRGIGFFMDIAGKRTQKPPKFDGSLQMSQDFKSYLTTVLDRALADEGIDSQDLVKHGELAVKIKANGLIKIGAQRDGRIKILGKAKCHPDDAFNLETGVRLAVRRMVQAADKPFERVANNVYYFVDYDGSIMGKPWNDDVIDHCNLALDNYFPSTFSAWLHITSVKRSIRHLADALKLTPPEPEKGGD
ncbi:MAG: hypothetical protein ACI4NX_07075 [Megasphaera elsdenii]|uniref:hypothetical protein n=1 Tax=Megasphaera elsdenii TaxID=907 RepID=UPI003EFD2F9E